MPVEIKISWEGLDPALEKIRAMIAAGKDLTPAHKVIGEQMLNSIDKNFAVAGRPDPWAPHSAATIAAYTQERLGLKSSWKTDQAGNRTGLTAGASKRVAAIGSGRFRLLQKTGRLRRSISFAASAQNVRVGSNVLYAAIHQFGGTAGRAHKIAIPARPFLAVQDPEDVNMIRNAYLKLISGGNQ